MGSGEMPIEPGNSWFSPKCIEGQPWGLNGGGRALDGLGGVSLLNPTKPPMPFYRLLRVRLSEISSMVERETAQTAG